MKTMLIIAGLLAGGYELLSEAQDFCEMFPQAPWCQKKTAEAQDFCEQFPQAPWCKVKKS